MTRNTYFFPRCSPCHDGSNSGKVHRWCIGNLGVRASWRVLCSYKKPCGSFCGSSWRSYIGRSYGSCCNAFHSWNGLLAETALPIAAFLFSGEAPVACRWLFVVVAQDFVWWPVWYASGRLCPLDSLSPRGVGLPHLGDDAGGAWTSLCHPGWVCQLAGHGLDGGCQWNDNGGGNRGWGWCAGGYAGVGAGEKRVNLSPAK